MKRGSGGGQDQSSLLVRVVKLDKEEYILKYMELNSQNL